MLNRRRFLQGTAALAFAGLHRTAFAEEQSPVPIVFVHGDSDLAATWETQIWRFESNGYPRNRLFAISFTDPQARDDDSVAQPNRSSTRDQLRELTAFIDGVKAQTGAAKVAIVALSRGGYSTRGYVAANPASVTQAVLGGTPNHGVFAIDALLGSEYNGRGPFLQKLNAGDSEVTPGVPFMTLRSNGFDLYAQPDGGILFGKPAMPLNVTADGPALKGATNILLGEVDHRETALGPVAFAQIYKFITGRAPARIAIAPEAEVVLNGRVTGVVAGTPTNRPVEGARVDIYVGNRRAAGRRGACQDDRRRRRLGAGDVRCDDAARIRRRRSRRARHPYLSLALAALVRQARSQAGGGSGERGRRRGGSGADGPAARLLRSAPRHRVAGRQAASRHPAGRARRLAYDAEAGSGRGPADHRRVQRGADRRSSLAGERRPHDDHGADRLRAFFRRVRRRRACGLLRERESGVQPGRNEFGAAASEGNGGPR